MNIKIFRYSSQSKTTLGAMLINDKFECYTLEDSHKDVKVKHQTRIPSGKYEIKLREFGGHYEKYLSKYDGHGGMLWLQDVPNFEDILIHIGNDAEDTSGCILVGSTANNNANNKGFIGASTRCLFRYVF